MRRTRRSLPLKTFFVAATWLVGTSAAAEVKVSNRVIGDATHIELSGSSEWGYDVRRDKDVISVQFAHLAKSDLQSLAGIADDRIKEVRVKDGLNGGALVEFVMNSSMVSMFDYQTESPTRLIFDVYEEEKTPKKRVVQKEEKSGRSGEIKPGKENGKAPKAAQTARVAKKQKRKVASDHVEVPANQPTLPNLVARNGQTAVSTPSSVDEKIKLGIFDGGDPKLERFSIRPDEISDESFIRSRQNIYIRFPELVIEHAYLNVLTSNPPQYEVPAEKTEENEQFRLIMKLHADKKPALLIRTLRFFREKYPSSKYDETIAFAEADAYYELWHRENRPADFEEAMARYKNILNKYPANALNHRTLMFIGLNYLFRGNNFGALSTFQVGIKAYPDSPYYWPMRVAVAEALRQLNKYQESLDEFRSIEADPRAGSFAVEAGFRRGDVYFHQKKYQDAVSEYKTALGKYPAKWADYPNAYFNAAESQFWLNQYKDSLDSYRGFLQHFPIHPNGGFAMTRMGEILEILGASKQKVMGAFLESVFRYRGTQGAAIARLRLHADRFKEMKPKELEAARAEIAELFKDSKLEHIEDFNTVVQSDGFFEAHQFDKSLEMLINQYQGNPLSPYLPVFKKRIERNLTAQFNHFNGQGRYLKSLEIYAKNRENWLKRSDRIDTRFAVAQAYEGMNVPAQAESYYRDCLNGLAVTDKDKAFERKVFEQVPTADRINLRLAKTAAMSDDHTKAAAYLREVKNPDSLSSEEALERSLIVAQIAEKEGQSETAYIALKDVVDKWKGQSTRLAEPWLRIAKILADENKSQEALMWTQKVVNAYKDTQTRAPATAGDGQEESVTSAVPSKFAREAAELEGDLYSAQGKTDAAAQAYSYLIEKLSEGFPTGSVRYKLGKLYYDKGNLKEAAKHWDPLKKETGGELWAKLAQENLDNAQWRDRYKRYVNGKVPNMPSWAVDKQDGNQRKNELRGK